MKKSFAYAHKVCTYCLSINIEVGMLVRNTMKIALFMSVMVGMPAMAASVTTDINSEQSSKDTPMVRLSAAGQVTPMVSNASFRQFAPKTQTNYASIDYQVWDDALENIVLRLGQSLRIRSLRPDPIVGTRIVKGHKSGYRMEGSRVTFSYLNDEYRLGLTEYRKDLERLANQVDITRLSRNEQLAFWFNLHNVTLIEQIAHNYPVRRPEKLLVGPNKQPLNDAKLLNIRGVSLSLRDIRENIVYPNWSNPDVMYGFFRGNIGGPALQNYAFTSGNVDAVLKLQANDFVNSLRGVNENRRALKVSMLYDEARGYYFSNWPNDLTTHLRKHANPAVMDILAKDKPVEFDRYDPIVADLLAGDRPSTQKLNLQIDGEVQRTSISPEIARLLRELDQKTEIMKKRGMLKTRGTVTIDDIPTIDIDIPDETE